MDLRRPIHDEIATFVRVVRQGTLAGAARELGVPKSTVSRRIGRLEQQLAVKLLHRAARRVVPTDEGCSLYDRVAASIDTIDVAVQAAHESMAMPRGTIRLTAPPDIGRILLLRELAVFGERYSEISLELQLTDRYVDLVQEGFDLALRAGFGPQSSSAQNLIARKLMPTRLKLAAAPAMAPAVRTIDDLGRLPFVLFRAPERRQTLRLETGKGRPRQVLVSGRFVVYDYSAMAELVAAGAGLGLMPQLHIEHPPRPGALQPVLPDLATPAGNILAVYPTRQLPRRVSLLLEHLTRAFGD